MCRFLPSPEALADFLARVFKTNHYSPDEQGGVFRPGDRLIRRLGLTLEPEVNLNEWIENQYLDALWLHRPWLLDQIGLPPGIPVLAHHLPFDETLTLGFNRQLAEKLALDHLEEIGHKQTPGLAPRAIGMLGDAPEGTFETWRERIGEAFGGYETAITGRILTINRVAVVGAMTDALVREAAQRGATLYLTGQLRKPAAQAVAETGLSVIEVGHRRSEEWGLRALAGVLQEAWTGLEVVIWR